MIIGVDAGKHIGMCALDTADKFVRGHTAESPAEAIEWIDSMFAVCAPAEEKLLAIEGIAGYAWEGTRSSALIHASSVAGFIAGYYFKKDVTVSTTTAGKWRKYICGKSNASDKLIKLVMTAIKGFPSVSNAHVRDAAGVALYVARSLRISNLETQSCL